jgi:hypothetical protein
LKTYIGGGPSQANQAALEAETNQDTYAPPDLIKHSPGVAKVWCHIDEAGTLSSPSYGMSSITDNGTGDRTLNFSTAFSSAIYSATHGLMLTGDAAITSKFSQLATGSCQLLSHSNGVDNHQGGVLSDYDNAVQIFGDQ